MKKYLFHLAAVILLGACSSPKYTYYFDHYDYNAGKKKTENHLAATPADETKQPVSVSNVDVSPLTLDKEALTASAEESKSIVSNTAKTETASKPVKTYKEMTKTERKEFRKEAKQLMKSYIKAKKEGDEVKAAAAAQAMDHDLKLAAIFGAVGIVALLIGGDVFWVLGAIALIIGVVFLVLWISRQ